MPITADNKNHIVSVIIPTIGRRSLAETETALKGQTRRPDEVIVVLDTARHGASWARNEGIRQACGDLLAFIDDDCIPPRDWLANLIDGMDSFGAAAVGVTYDETDPLLHDLRKRRCYTDNVQIDADGLVNTGGNIMFQRAWLDLCRERDGFIFNENIDVGEDHEVDPIRKGAKNRPRLDLSITRYRFFVNLTVWVKYFFDFFADSAECRQTPDMPVPSGMSIIDFFLIAQRRYAAFDFA